MEYRKMKKSKKFRFVDISIKEFSKMKKEKMVR